MADVHDRCRISVSFRWVAAAMPTDFSAWSLYITLFCGGYPKRRGWKGEGKLGEEGRWNDRNDHIQTVCVPFGLPACLDGEEHMCSSSGLIGFDAVVIQRIGDVD